MRAQALPLRLGGNAQIQELAFMSRRTQDAVPKECLPRHEDPALMILPKAVPKVALSPGGKVSRTLYDEHRGKIREHHGPKGGDHDRLSSWAQSACRGAAGSACSAGMIPLHSRAWGS